MATTHTLVADTRMEDLPGLASGDTIALGGHVLTCETDLSAITGLYATGTGTIRLLDGGNCDFSGSNPLPATVTIEGGTEDNPLPAHGDYGYVGRAAAVITLRGGTTFSGNIISHCVGNSNRVQAAIVTTSTSSSIALDREVDWEAGDAIGWTNGPSEGGDTSIFYLAARTASGNMVTHAANTTVPAGAVCSLLTVGFAVGSRYGSLMLDGHIRGDELGVYVAANNSDGVVCGNINIARIALLPWFSCSYSRFGALFGPRAMGRAGIAVTSAYLCGARIASNTNNHFPYPLIGPLLIGTAVAAGIGHTWGGTHYCARVQLSIRNGWIILSKVAPSYGRSEYVDVSLPKNLYSSIVPSDELVVRTTNPPTHTVHRAGGIATLVDRADIEVPTSLPDAWRLDPIEDGTAWHDVPMTVLPGKTLSCIWYWMLGEEGATAGCQILDGECPGWGSIAMNPGMAEVLAETAVPDGASPLRPFVAVPISWRNPGREIRKVVLRGWARGGTAYSRIDPAAGGLA